MSEEENYQNPERVSEVRPKKLADVVKFLVIINILVFLAQLYLDNNGFGITETFALFSFESEHFAIWQLVTHMFLHGGYLHLFLNMFILWMFGSALEYVWKPKKFIFYYFFTGIGAALLHGAVTMFTISQLESEVNDYKQDPSYSAFSEFVHEEIGELPETVPQQARVLQEMHELEEKWAEDPENEAYARRSEELMQGYLQFHINRPSLGASGAVFGILLAFGFLFPNQPVYIYFLFPIKAKYFVIFLGALELYVGVFEENNVANFAHLGGMIFGFILVKIWGEKPRI
ncbi:rhomboid family intramembrane serine protease [Cytophagaceae bacterium ABcell3]|nr:rhomboid family intramembrane serine protease [Cytophagaceae bacterium ABcell3]